MHSVIRRLLFAVSYRLHEMLFAAQRAWCFPDVSQSADASSGYGSNVTQWSVVNWKAQTIDFLRDNRTIPRAVYAEYKTIYTWLSNLWPNVDKSDVERCRRYWTYAERFTPVTAPSVAIGNGCQGDDVNLGRCTERPI